MAAERTLTQCRTSPRMRDRPRVELSCAGEHGNDGTRLDPRRSHPRRLADLAAVVIVVLAVAWVTLFLLPDQTDHRFAWTITPTMTAMLMGAGYGSAAYFYARLLVGRRWHHFGLGFLPTSVFTWLMLTATVLHWDRFHHGTFPFLLWWWSLSRHPIAVPAVWLANRRHDPRTPESAIARTRAGCGPRCSPAGGVCA